MFVRGRAKQDPITKAKRPPPNHPKSCTALDDLQNTLAGLACRPPARRVDYGTAQPGQRREESATEGNTETGGLRPAREESGWGMGHSGLVTVGRASALWSGVGSMLVIPAEVCVCIHACRCTCTCARICSYLSTYLIIVTQSYTHRHTHTHTYIHTYICIYIYTHMYV